MINTIQTYLNYLTSSWQNKPNFTAMISVDVGVQVQVQALLEEMLGPLFDLATPPVGDQLDIIGEWAGVSRNVSIPITGIFFTWNGPANLGWNYGSWQPSDNPSSITVLPDDAYLTLIFAKIASNYWDGTIDGAYAIWDRIFPQYTILIQDYQNMSYALVILGGVVDALTLALLTGGYIPLRPEGVEVTGYFTPIDDNPAFAWDVEATDTLAGWNIGSWLAFTPST
jgi:hypothetical protein